MNTFLLYLILKLGTIGTLLFWGPVLYFIYLLGGLLRVFWNIPAEAPWPPYWEPRRRKLCIAALAMLCSTMLPTTREATVMYVVPVIAQSSIWERVFGGGVSSETMEESRRWVRDTVGK